jgi:hypothetical protein
MFTLNGVISTEEIRNLFIPDVEESLVSSNFVTMETVLDAESVKIPGVGDVAVSPYTGTATTSDATDTSKLLVLDQASYFQKSIDKVDNAQSAVKIISKVLEKGAMSTADAIDTYMFDVLADAANTVPTIALDATNVSVWISDMGVALTNQKAPKRDRKLAVTPEVSALISQANLALNTTTAEEAAKEGFVGRFGGFDIYETPNLYTTSAGVATCIGAVADGTYGGIGFQEYNVGEPVEGFKWIAKGLANYGAVIAQEAYVVACEVSLA